MKKSEQKNTTNRALAIAFANFNHMGLKGARQRREDREEKIDRKKPQSKNIMACPITQGGHNNCKCC